ncbi:hypothetical protein N7463_000593 [Penicillium fimorum]|uniref:C2H2-type domain-containing protein n=1 Tax=Penicillium fimorum TaxID=1882269 RepID=A0A9W9Y4K3_9EURO|nr:hypothetical protein N7463_000593 [Penicillium fimorum]
MGYASTVGQPHVLSVDWSRYDPSMGHVSTVGQPSVLAVDWSRYDPSTGHAFSSLDSSHIMPIAPRPATMDNLYQSNMQSSSARQYGAAEIETGYISPGQPTIQIQSSELRLSPQETSLPNEQSIEVADVEATYAHDETQKRDESGGPFECLWEGCTRRNALSSLSSLMCHIRVQHVVHRSVKCPECGQAFGRMDNMKGHRRTRHWKFDRD